MCGILGVVAPLGQLPKIDLDAVNRMRDRMIARGPDDFGTFPKRNIIFAHRRLAIRDIEGGKQPWISEDENQALVFNGEIYNDSELRHRLRSLGHNFRTRSDTEVVLESYRRWGAECVNQFRGMFAFGIYDFHKEELVLVRDRIGVKPLFFSEIGGDLIFASTVDAITKHPQFQGIPSLEAMSHYLTTLRQTLGRQTMFQGIWKLMPGERLHMQNGNVRIDRYWDLSVPDSRSADAPTRTVIPFDIKPKNNDAQLEYENCEETLVDQLDDSIEVRLNSDVPVGMFLSGGVDSSTLAHIMREKTESSFPVLCANGSSEDVKEHDAHFAQQCADSVDCPLKVVSIESEEYLETWSTLSEKTSLPLTTPSDALIYSLAKETKKHVGVVLGGEGADELLFGYSVQHWSGDEYDLLNSIHNDQWQHGNEAAQSFLQSIHRQYGRVQFHSPVDHYFAQNSLITREAKSQLFHEHHWKQLENDRALMNHYHSFYESDQTAGNTSRLLHQVNLEALLSRLDTATMEASLEARVPFTDHLLIEKIWESPREHRISVASNETNPYRCAAELHQSNALNSKRILRSAAQKMMPESLAMRPKASFPTSVPQWISGEWNENVMNQIKNSAFAAEYFRDDAIRLISEDSTTAGISLWPMLNLVEWGDRQFAA